MTDKTNIPQGTELFRRKYEWDTRRVIRIEGNFFEAVENGGDRGAWSHKPTKVRTISQAEAQRIGLELDYDPEIVAEKCQ